MKHRKKVVLLGATGSIGKNTLEVLRKHSDKLELIGIASHTQYNGLASIIREFPLKFAVIFDETAYREAKERGIFDAKIASKPRHLSRFNGAHESSEKPIEWMSGMSGLMTLATLDEADIIVAAMSGVLGLKPALAAVKKGKRLALANKEILVLGGKWIMEAARQGQGEIIPLDSEHSAIFQCLKGEPKESIEKIILTASGGALWDMPIEAMDKVNLDMVLAHPNWNMGQKITVDCATLANKALELIEAHWLFDMPSSRLDAVIHRQSIVHSMIQYRDGSIIAQLGIPTMTLPIQYGLLYPYRAEATEQPLNFNQIMQWSFQPIDYQRFHCFRLGREALDAGGILPVVFNAANEIAVTWFLKGFLPFSRIGKVIEETMYGIREDRAESLEEALAIDEMARMMARDCASSQS